MANTHSIISGQNKRLVLIVLFVAVLLLIPLIAMQFTTEVNWSLFDFIIGGALLLSAGFSVEIALRTIRTSKGRLIAVALILLLLFLVWAELAVGVFGTPFAGS